MTTVSKRTRKIGRPDPVYLAHDPAKPTAVIFDIDGTLALLGGRNPYDASTCDRDPIHGPVVATAHMTMRHYPIIVCSGRHERNRARTESWLKAHGIIFTELLMRPDDDNRNDAIIKAEIFRDKIAPRYNILCAYDDRDRVVAMWRWLGVPCFQVQYGDF